MCLTPCWPWVFNVEMEALALQEILKLAIASGNLWVPKSRWRRERLGWYDLPLSQLSSPPTEAGTGDKVYVQGPRTLMSSPPGPG